MIDARIRMPEMGLVGERHGNVLGYVKLPALEVILITCYSHHQIGHQFS